MKEALDGLQGKGGAVPSPDLPRSILSNLREGCQVLDQEYRYIFVNEAAARHGRTTKAALLGRTMTEAFPGIEATEMFSALRQCMTDRTPRTMENEFCFPDQSKAWFELRMEPVPEGLLVLSIDITERKLAEAALARSEARYRQLVDNIEDVVFSTDAEGRVEYMSQAVQRTYGFAPAEVLGKHFSEFVHPEDLPALAASFERTLSGVIEPMEFRGLDKQARLRYLRSTSRVRRVEGQVAGVDGVIIDWVDIRDGPVMRRSSRNTRIQTPRIVLGTVATGQPLVV